MSSSEVALSAAKLQSLHSRLSQRRCSRPVVLGAMVYLVALVGLPSAQMYSVERQSNPRYFFCSCLFCVLPILCFSYWQWILSPLLTDFPLSRLLALLFAAFIARGHIDDFSLNEFPIWLWLAPLTLMNVGLALRFSAPLLVELKRAIQGPLFPTKSFLMLNEKKAYYGPQLTLFSFLQTNFTQHLP